MSDQLVVPNAPKKTESSTCNDSPSFTSAHKDITMNGDTVSIARGVRMEGTAMCEEPQMRSGKHFAEFTLLKTDKCTISVVRADFDCEQRKLACSTADGWGYYARVGTMHHSTLRAMGKWTGQTSAREGTVIGLLLDCDRGSLTVYHNSVRTGDLVRSGLPSDGLCWMVQLTDGAEVRIEKKEVPADPGPPRHPPPSTTSSPTETVQAYLKRVGLDAWFAHFDKHLPANVKSVRLVRATTAADLRRMGTKANMWLDAATIQQVLNALKKP